MSLADLGMEFTGSFLEDDGILEYVEHLRDGTVAEYELTNVFPFTSIADLKRMIWIDVGGTADYTPRFVFMAIQNDDGLFVPLEFHWPTESKLPAALQNPFDEQEPRPELVDSAGNRSGITATLHKYTTIEDSLRANNVVKPKLHIWRLSEIIGADPTVITPIQFAGFIRLYFPWLQEISTIEDSYAQNESETSKDDKSYDICKVYIESRQEQLMRLENELKKHGDKPGELFCRAIEKLIIGIPPIVPEPESLEILFYELKLSQELPFIRYFSDRGDQEPILRYLKNAYIPADAMAAWLKEPVSKKEQLILGKILIRGNRIPAGSAFDVLFFADKSARVEIQSPRKDHLFLGSLIEEGLKGLEKFVTTNAFQQEENKSPLKLYELHGKFVWDHPIIGSPRPSIEEIKNRIRNYSYMFELEKGEPAVINLRYTALSNFESDNNITGYISRLAAAEFPDQELSLKETTLFFADKIQRRFAKSPDESTAIFQHWLENKGKQETVAQGKGEDAVPLHHDGVIITIRNNHPSYEIEIANLHSANSGETLRRIFTGLAIILLEKTDAKENPVVVEAAEAIKKENEENKGQEPVAESRVASAIAAAGADMDFLNFLEEGEEGEEEAEEAEGGAAAALGSVPSTVIAEVTPVILASRAPVAEINPSAASSDEVQKDVSKFYITKLKQLDTDLFGYQDKRAGKSKGYSSACQTSNGDMPHSLSQSQYARVKEIYKDKITFVEGPKPAGWKLTAPPPLGYGPKMSWDFDKNFTPPRPVWVTLRSGSEVRRNWFLCVKYWCLRDDIPLIESEFESNQECPQCHGKAIKGDKPNPGETVLVRRTDNGFKKYIGFQTKSKHPDNYPLPCCGIKPKEDKLVDKTRSYDKVSIEPVPEPEPLPAGIHADVEEAKASQTRGVIPTVEINKVLSSLETKYIKSVGKYPLGPGELGIVPKQIDSLFGQDSTIAIKKSGPQQMLAREHIVFIRFGLQNTELPGNRFLSMLGFWMGTFDLNAVIAKMTTPAFVHAFEDANYGTLVHEFARPDLPAEPVGDSFRLFIEKNGYAQNEGTNRANLVRLFYAYQNFMNYVRDANTPKDIRYFEHLLMMPGALLTRGILLFRILRDEADDWAVQCPAFGIPSTKDAPTPVFIIHDSKYNIWEPLVLYAGSEKAIVTFDSKSLYGKLGQSTSTAIYNWILEIKKKGVGCGRLQTPPYTWKPVQSESAEAPPVPTISEILRHCIKNTITPRGIVRERSNRFVGFIFENRENRRFFVPARDDGTSLHQWPRFYESTALLPAPALGDIQKYYSDNNFFNFDGLQIIKILISNEQPAKYVAVLLGSGVIIPIDPTQETGGLDVQPVTDFPWDLDEELSPLPVAVSSTALDVETAEGFINEAYQYLRLILANHFKRDEDGARVLVQLKALRDAINLPLYERRKRMDTILQSVVYQFVKETPYTEKLKDLPRIRKNIGDPATKIEDCPPGIASWSNSRCMLHTPSERIMTARLTDEILRNPWAFAEIDEKKVSRVRPLSGTVETATEIITTDTFTIGSQAGVQKTKYTQGLQFAEEQLTTMDILKAVMGGEGVASDALVQSMTRHEKAFHLDLPVSFKGQYKIFAVTSPNAAADKLTLGLVYLFNSLFQETFTIEKIHEKVKYRLRQLKAPADVVEGGWRSSPYDFLALSQLSQCRLVLITTSATGQTEVKYYFNPKGIQNKADIIIFWGETPDLVVDLAGSPRHHVNTLPNDLSEQIEKMEADGTVIQRLDQLKVPLEPQRPVLEAAPVSAPVSAPVPVQIVLPMAAVTSAPPAEVAQPQEEAPQPLAEQVEAPQPPAEVAQSQEASPSLEVPQPEPAEEGFSLQEPEVPQPAPPVEESPLEPAVAFGGVVEEPAGEEPEVAAEAPPAEPLKIDLPQAEESNEEANEEAAEEAANGDNEELDAEAQEALNQIVAAQPSLPPQPPAEQQISRPPPPASSPV